MDSFCNRKIEVDLHIHTICSDGTDTPEKVVELAKERGLSLISITDHDTVSGIKSAEIVAKKLGIDFIPGIEVTADTFSFPKGAEFHILGYSIDVESVALKQLVDFFSGTRKERNRLLIKKLEKEGFNISYDDVSSCFGENFGKPNIVTVLVEKKLVSDRKEAFTILKRCEVKRKKLDYREIFLLIKEAGGVPVVAHPVTLGISRSSYFEFFKKFKSNGLEGIEVVHSLHTPSHVRYFREIASELSLFTTGGSDYHGYNKPDISLGMLKIKLKDLNFSMFAGV